MRKTFLLSIFTCLLALSLVFSCTSEAKEQPHVKTEDTILVTVPDQTVVDGRISVLYEVVDDNAIQTVQAKFVNGKAEVKFNQNKGTWHRYLLLVSNVAKGEKLVIGGGESPLYVASTIDLRGRQKSINLTPELVSSVLTVDCKGIGSGEAIMSVDIQFPAGTAASSTYTFDPTEGHKFNILMAGSTSHTVVNDPSTRSVNVDLSPCKIRSGESAKVEVTTNKDIYCGTIVFTDGLDLKAGKSVTVDVELDNTQNFTNPVITQDWPDPTIWTDGTKFYTIATGVGKVLSSNDLVIWSQARPRVLSETALVTARTLGAHFWAPDVCKIGDKWMLYLTCYNSASDCGIHAFSSSSPNGPFDYVGKITHSKDTGIQDTIDAEVVTDPETGKVWLFFGSIGKVHRIELNSEGTALAKGAQYVHVAGLTYAQNTSRSKVFEGSYVYHHGDWWYLFVSSGNYGNASYMMKVGRSSTIDGVFLDKNGSKMTDGNATVILSSATGDRFYGPGHNGEIFTDRKGQDYMLYHCHDSNLSTSSRFTFLQRIYWDKDGWPYFVGGKPLAEDVAPWF